MLISAPFLSSAVPALADGIEPTPSATAKSHQDHQKPTQQDELDEDTQKQSQIAKKYGDEREVATPPLIVKPARPVPSSVPTAAAFSVSVRSSAINVNGASVPGQRLPIAKYVSQPLDVAMHQLQKPNQGQPAVKSQIKAFDTSKNAPVIQNINRDDLGSPAQEFLGKAYFGMAVMLIFGALLVAYFFRKLKAARRSNQNDG